MLTCHDIANYFLATLDSEAGDLMSNLKLQKLVYYAQGFHLALYDKPLFDSPIEAWAHGPVVPELYHRFKAYGANAIPETPAIEVSHYGPQVLELLEEVSTVYGQFSATKLRNMTHEEAPWKQTPLGQVISHERMQQFFKTRLVQA
ncbi:MAG: DUF4065 domain-containing protein [Bryobacter sp.]|nr:DUF4065 domain-containing protein [Bryobacter sp.]